MILKEQFTEMRTSITPTTALGADLRAGAQTSDEGQPSGLMQDGVLLSIVDQFQRVAV